MKTTLAKRPRGNWIATAMAGMAAVALPALVSAAEVAHFNSSGDTARAVYADAHTYTQLSVDTDTTGPTTLGFMYFFTSTCYSSSTSYSCSVVNLYGPVSGSEFEVTGRSATLNTNGTALQGVQYTAGCDFTTWVCYFNPTTVSGGSPFPISLSWKWRNDFSLHRSGTEIQRFGPYQIVTSGTSDIMTSDVSGMTLGTPFSTTQGYIGSAKNNSISINKN